MSTPANAEQWRVRTEGARRQARYLASLERIRRIREAEPRFTPQQLADLAAELTGSAA